MSNPIVSIITPVHGKNVPYLTETYASLQAQTFTDWEWVLAPNHGGSVPSEIAADHRVHVCPIDDDLNGNGHNSIGRIKHTAFHLGRGNILVELDADDLVTPNALDSIVAAFQDPQVQMAYSNASEFEQDTWKPHVYSEYWGWRARPFRYQDHDLIEMIAWEPSPHMMRRVEWAPNHVRAFRADAYRALGGHDQNISNGDDHDLCCRFYIAYGATGIRHIDKCLYLYRVHGENTCVVDNHTVQEQTAKNYSRYIADMALRWSKDNGLKAIDLGGRFNAWNGFATVDLHDADIIADLNERFPFDDNSVGAIHAAHILEHLKDPIHVMNEIYRVLAPGGFAFIVVPSTDGRGAFQDPTHITFWNENSFWYYTDRNFARFIQPGFIGRFQKIFSSTYYPTEFERVHNIPYTFVDLVALKEPYANRPVGEVLI